MPADHTSPLGLALSPNQLQFREQRARQLDGLYQHLVWALPAEVNAQLGERWTGQFEREDYPLRTRRRLELALLTGEDVEDALASLARTGAGDAVLVSWVDGLEGRPMTTATTALPGEVVDTPVGPVVIDATNEPYKVRAAIGFAVVASNGQVLSRSHGTYDAVMRGEYGLETAAQELSASVARAVAAVWEQRPAAGSPLASAP